MREITFKAETDLELFFMVNDYIKGYIENNGQLPELKAKLIKEKFLKLNPIGSHIISNTTGLKYYPFNKEYAILDIRVSTWSNNYISVLLNGDNNKTEWKDLKRFTGFVPFE
ncbi:hypothetical protein KRE40_12210 [Elizabethkingia meningoseptica]|uniref:hypothetical protein n=1 Tax=Elizabethkingia TaxID=308865 RepID=UPI0023B0F02D|nr:hypothetical protein [Elizabethkingia meningoseptica]MCT4315507.1 hypothetical protein [Elizabethkingia anophelis]MDE5509407.1 hypothetical protein [Elizabethkingia meningoseptica]HAY3534669.1 hypothetical protein [Elizabethkingia anophelis]HAY3546785.1 hypothetical protein [Elizabethkingia anophelis]